MPTVPPAQATCTAAQAPSMAAAAWSERFGERPAPSRNAIVLERRRPVLTQAKRPGA